VTRALIAVQRCEPLISNGGWKLITGLEKLFGENSVRIEGSNIIIIDPVDRIKLTQFILSYNSDDYGWSITTAETEEDDDE